MELHMFEYADTDSVIAHDGVDADLLFREFNADALDAAEMKNQLATRVQLPDEEALVVWWNAERGEVTDSASDGALTEHTNAEWAAIVGRGWFCSTEF